MHGRREEETGNNRDLKGSKGVKKEEEEEKKEEDYA